MRKFTVGALLVVGLPAITLAVYLLVTQPPGDRGVGARLDAIIERDDGALIDFDSVATFAWTDLHVIGAYSDADYASRVLGFEWPYRYPYPTWDDGNAVLVFVDSTRIVATLGIVKHKRGWTVRSTTSAPAKRGDAKFAWNAASRRLEHFRPSANDTIPRE